MANQLSFRLATQNDLPSIVQLYADDTLGASREQYAEVLSENYLKAFEAICADSSHELTVVEVNGEIVATFHLTFIPYLNLQGGLRAQVESVMTASSHRGQGIGKKMFDYIFQRAKAKGCVLVQLTTDKRRPDAIRFYERLGFVASHEGLKFRL
jgi:GNAT superfamily N-acetyltransferase